MNGELTEAEVDAGMLTHFLITYMVTRIGVHPPIEYGQETTRDTVIGWLCQKNLEFTDVKSTEAVPGTIVDNVLILNVLEITAQEAVDFNAVPSGVIVPLDAKYDRGPCC